MRFTRLQALPHESCPLSRPGLEPGLVVAGHGRHVWVETPDGRRLICHPRGKKSVTVVGDQVLWQATQDEGTIEKVLPRRNLFYRQDEIRTKSFAANLDQVLILIAAEPEFSESQLSRALIAAEAERIKPIIALNKSDLAGPFGRAWDRLTIYRDMGYTLVPLNLHFSKGNVKCEIGLARGKKQHDKRAATKEREWEVQKGRIARGDLNA